MESLANAVFIEKALQDHLEEITLNWQESSQELGSQFLFQETWGLLHGFYLDLRVEGMTPFHHHVMALEGNFLELRQEIK